MLVQDIMSGAELALSPGETVSVALKECACRDLFMAPVVEDGKYRGMFSISRAVKAGEAVRKKPVSDVMDQGFPVVLKDTLVIDIPKDFTLFLPVIDGRRNFLGVIRSADVLRSYETGVHYSLSSLRSLIDSTNNGIVAVNKNGVINIFNASARRILEMGDASPAGRSITDVLPKSRLLQEILRLRHNFRPAVVCPGGAGIHIPALLMFKKGL